jgi:hypothetical protein
VIAFAMYPSLEALWSPTYWIVTYVARKASSRER